MALTERCENDKIEIVGPYKMVQVRCATVIEKDGIELTRSFHRRSLAPGFLDEDDNFTDTDLSNEDSEVQAICASVWTSEIKNAYEMHLHSKK